MSIKLTETQLAMLRAAATRDDRCVLLPTTLRVAQLRKAGEKLIDAGYVREVKAKPSSPVWRSDEAIGSSYALKLTAAGAKAAKEGEATTDNTSCRSGPSNGEENGAPPVVGLRPAPTTAPQCDVATFSSKPAMRAPSGAPRFGSKIAAVIALLQRNGGATVTELIAATDWLPHTTRAALTGLRKRGYKVASDRSDLERGSLYRIEPGSPVKGPEPSNQVAEAP